MKGEVEGSHACNVKLEKYSGTMNDSNMVAILTVHEPAD